MTEQMLDKVARRSNPYIVGEIPAEIGDKSKPLCHIHLGFQLYRGSTVLSTFCGEPEWLEVWRW